MVAETGKGIVGIGTSTVFLRRRADIRLKPLLNLVYEDLIEDVEVMEAGEDETVVMDDVLLGCLYSDELSEVTCVNGEAREGKDS